MELQRWADSRRTSLRQDLSASIQNPVLAGWPRLAIQDKLRKPRWRCFMILKYPQWQEPLAPAILEFDAQQLRGKVQRAEGIITYSIQELAVDKGNEEERRELSDGLSIVQHLKKERLGFRDGNN